MMNFQFLHKQAGNDLLASWSRTYFSYMTERARPVDIVKTMSFISVWKEAELRSLDSELRCSID